MEGRIFYFRENWSERDKIESRASISFNPEAIEVTTQGIRVFIASEVLGQP